MQLNENSQMAEQTSAMQPSTQQQLSNNQLFPQLNNSPSQQPQHPQGSSPQQEQNQQTNQSDQQNQQEQQNKSNEGNQQKGDQQNEDQKETKAKQIIQELKQFYHIPQTQPKQGDQHSNQEPLQRISLADESPQQQAFLKQETSSNIQQQQKEEKQNEEFEEEKKEMPEGQSKEEKEERDQTPGSQKKEEMQQKEKIHGEKQQFWNEQQSNDIIEIDNQQAACQQKQQEGRQLGYFKIYARNSNPKASFLIKQKAVNKYFSNPTPIPEIIAQQNSPAPKLQAKNQSDGKWLQYLKSVYNHYCKSTYATGKFPTFDRIRESTSCLNINTFVHFCRDFDIDINRLKLIEIFKKATHFQKEMNFEQLVEAVHSLSKQKMSKQNQPENSYQNSFDEFLKLIHLDNSASFHNRMVLLGIKARKHGINANQSLAKPKKQSPYKFHIFPSNGRNPEDICQQLELIKVQKQDNRIRLQKLRHERIKKQEQEFELSTKMPIRTKIIKTGGYMSPLRPLKLTVQTSPDSHQKLTSSNIGYPKTSLNCSYIYNEYRQKQLTTQRSVCESKMQKSSANVKEGRSNSLSNCLNSGYLMNFRSKRDSKKQVKTQNLELNKIVREARKQEYRQNSEQVSLQASFKEQTPQSEAKRYQTLQNEQKNVLPLHHQNGLKTESKYSSPNLLFVGNMGENQNQFSRIKYKEHSFEAFLGDIEADDDEYLSKHLNLGLLNV